MIAKRLKEILENIDDNTKIYIRNSINPCGNIQELSQIEISTISTFGHLENCLILNTHSSKDLEVDSEENTLDFINN